MALKAATFTMPLSAGVDQKSDRLQIKPPNLANCVNAIFTTPGRVSTRYGYTALANTLMLADSSQLIPFVQPGNYILPRAISPYKNELVKCFAHTLSSWSEGDQSWIVKGNLESINVTTNPIVENTYEQQAADSTTHPVTGVKLTAWQDSQGGVWAQFNDSVTGNELLPGFQISATAVKPKTLSIGNYIVLFWVDTSNLIYMQAWPADLSGPAIGPAQLTGFTSATGLNSTYPNYDATVVNTAAGQQIYLVYCSVDAGICILSFGASAPPWQQSTLYAGGQIVQANGNIYYCITGGTSAATGAGPSTNSADITDGTAHWAYYGAYQSNITTPTAFGQILAIPAPETLTVFADSIVNASLISAEFVVGWFDGTSISVAFMPTDLSTAGTIVQLAGGTNVVSLTGVSTTNIEDGFIRNVYLFASQYAGLPAPPNLVNIAWANIQGTDGTPVVVGGTLAYGVALAGKAFATMDYAYVPVAYQSQQVVNGQSGLQNTYFLLNMVGDTVARLCPGTGGGYPVITQWDSNSSGPMLPEVTPIGNVGGGQGLTAAQTGGMVFSMPLLQTDLLTTLPATLTTPTDANGNANGPPSGTAVYSQTGIMNFVFDFNNSEGYLHEEIANTLVFNGGFPNYYDGTTSGLEVGFHLYPENITVAPSNSGGSMKPGQYWYAFTYEWDNSVNAVERSAPSVPVVAAIGPLWQPTTSLDWAYNQWIGDTLVDSGNVQWPINGNTATALILAPGSNPTGSTSHWSIIDPNGNVLLAVTSGNIGTTPSFTPGEGSVVFGGPMLRITAKGGTPNSSYYERSPVTIMPYRAVSTGGTVYYQDITSITPAASPATNTPIINDAAATGQVWSFTDQLADSSIQGNVQIYTTGNVIQNYATDPLGSICIHNNRFWGIGPDGTIWFSQMVIPGSPVQMSGYLTYQLGTTTLGQPKALAIRELGEMLLIFTKNSILRVDGVGPDATGGQGNYQTAVTVVADCGIGAGGPRSIVQGPLGLYFQSTKGLAHIDRSLTVTYIGANVQRSVNNDSITSAQIVPYTQQVRFTLENGKSAAVHDYFVNQWGIHTNVAAVDACVWDGTYVYLRQDGTAMVETPGLYSDNGSFISMSITSPWFYPGGLNNWGQTHWCYLQGTAYSNCNVAYGMAFNGNPAIVQRGSIPVTVPNYFGGDPTFGGTPFGGDFNTAQYRIQPRYMLAGSTQVTLTTQQSGNVLGQSISLSALTWESEVETSLRQPNTGASF